MRYNQRPSPVRRTVRLAGIASVLLLLRAGCLGLAAHRQTGAAVAEVRIDVASCREDEFRLLPGVGPARAAALVEFRRRYGPPRCPADLEKVPGIGPATAARLTPAIDFAKQTERLNDP